MIFENITIIDEHLETKKNMFVGIEGDKIAYIGDSPPEKNFGEKHSGKGKLLMSGFVNAHAHSPMTLLRGYGENMALQDWLTKRIFPFEEKLDNEKVYWGTLLAMAESIRFGIVSTTDMYFFSESMVKAILESGTKNNISRAITNFTNSSIWDMASGQEMKRLYDTYNNADNGRLIVDMSLHGEYTSNKKTVMELADYTSKIGANMHVHISETEKEHEECKAKYNMTPVQYLNSNGLFDTKTTAAHCVYIEGEDYNILKEKGVTVAVNPISNMKLASGICNVPKLLDKGINVAIGTDSVASNNSLNFIEEMKNFALSPKVAFKDPTAVTTKETIKCATYNGAQSQGRVDCGKLKVGYRADLIVLDINSPSMHPVHNMINNVVYSASGSDVIMTIVDGKILYDNGEYKTIDIEKTIYEVEKATKDIKRSL